MSFVRRFVSCFALAALLFAGSATAAGAVTPEEMPGRDAGCDSLGQNIVKPDGAILAVGSVGCEYPDPQEVLIQFTADGKVDAGFSDGGVKVLPREASVSALMPAGQSGAVFATGTKLTKITSGGSLDQTFGQGGEIDLAEVFEYPIYAAATQPDGKIVLSGYGGSATVKFARITSDGELDDQFGGDGAVEHALPAGLQMSEPSTAIAFDDSNRIIAANRGGDSKRPFVLRLLEDGGLDTTFGPGNDGFSVFELGASSYQTSGYVTAVTVSGNGDIWMYGTASAGIYWYDNVAFGFDSSGTPKGDEPVVHGSGGSGVFAVAPDGNLASTNAQERFGPSYFNITETNRAGSPVAGFSSEPLALSPGGGKVEALTYGAAGDSLIATGSVSGDECSPVCSDKKYMAIAKVDARTGVLDPSFGTGGVTLVPGNECAYGSSPNVNLLPWTRCALKPPRVSAKIRFKHGATRRPALSGTVTLSGAQEKPGVQRRRVVVDLPRALKFRSWRKSLMTVSSETSRDEGKTTIDLKGRKIVILFTPNTIQDPSEVPTGNAPITFKWNLKRGALKPVARKLRRKALSFPIRGSFLAGAGYSRFFVGGNTIKVVKARVQP